MAISRRMTYILYMLYNILFIPTARLVIKVMGIFNPKLRLREDGWKNALSKLESINSKDDNAKRIWFHASSMGEFEQAKPIIELFKKNYKEVKVIVSFFSPSGFENQKNYEFADAVLYLPFDRLKDVQHFLSVVKPDIAVFVRYEIWRNFLQELNKLSIKTFLIDATKPASTMLTTVPLLKDFTRRNYNFFEKIFTVDEKQTVFFKNFDVKPEVITLSDTRFDRIADKVAEASELKTIPKDFFSNDDFVIVLGSCWQPDEKIAFNAVKKWNSKHTKKIKMIVVPHEPTKQHIADVISSGLDFVLLSDIEKHIEDSSFINENRSSHILVDSIGKLLMLYTYADAAYIGGAFGAGVHSVTEPAGYGIPLATGIAMENSPDAINLRELNALTVIKHSEDLYCWLEAMVEDKNHYGVMAASANEYINSRLGSSSKIYEYLKNELRV